MKNDCNNILKELNELSEQVEMDDYGYHDYKQVRNFKEIIGDKSDDIKVELYDLLKSSEEIKRFKELENFLRLINTKYEFNLSK